MKPAARVRDVSLALRVIEHQAHVFRRFWRGSVFSYILNPILFLAAIGLGLGGLVDQRNASVGGVKYLAFVAPGMMAAAAMQGAAGESLWPVMAGTKWVRTFHAMVATPVSPAAIYEGLISWTAVRVAIGAACFLVVAALLGGIPSGFAVLAIPAAVLCALAFAAPLTAFAATQDTDARFPVIMRLGVLPLFLFSGTFFPISQLPRGLRPIAQLSPLYHGVELCRAATTGSVKVLPAVGHVAVLIGCIAAGWLWGTRSFARKLTT